MKEKFNNKRNLKVGRPPKGEDYQIVSFSLPVKLVEQLNKQKNKSAFIAKVLDKELKKS